MIYDTDNESVYDFGNERDTQGLTPFNPRLEAPASLLPSEYPPANIDSFLEDVYPDIALFNAQHPQSLASKDMRLVEYEILPDEDIEFTAQPVISGKEVQRLTVRPRNVYSEQSKTLVTSETDGERGSRTRLRMELPMIIQGSIIVSRPDSGSEENVIRADLVSQLGLIMDPAPVHGHEKEFRIANGKFVKALGRISVKCSFAKDPVMEFYCSFYVFQYLITPLIMGMSFLDTTETLAKYRYRLQPRGSPLAGPLQLCSLNSPRCRLFCHADMQAMLANADTGSEVDLMSLAYVRKRNFTVSTVDLRSTMVQFADGSVDHLLGKVVVWIVLGDPDGPRLKTTFYILENLTCDILFGEDFLNETAAFESYQDAFLINDPESNVCEVNAIVWFNTAERYLSRIGNRGATVTDTIPDLGPKSTMAIVKKRVDRLFGRQANAPNFETPTAGSRFPEESIDEQDARELHRRELANKTIVTLPEAEKDAAIKKEKETIGKYEEMKSQLMSSRAPNAPALIREFKCDHPGCLAPAFQTQYLLNSHANVHYQIRSHHCPVAGCSRSEGGKGFKRKNEMIRHGLMHQSPGYTCPFCPEREHKYPRPDNLQRHVRVEHVDKDANDPALRAILAQRSEGGSHGRRRRLRISSAHD